MINVFLLLGGNLGDREMYMNRAVEYISHEIGHVIKASSLYETQSWGKEDEPDYLNQVIEVETDLAPHFLLEKLLATEHKLGRLRAEKWGSRTIDIDMLFYGEQIINDAQLTVPHPRLHIRRFTMEPLAEIAPAFIHPVFKKNILELKNELQDNLIVKKL